MAAKRKRDGHTSRNVLIAILALAALVLVFQTLKDEGIRGEHTDVVGQGQTDSNGISPRSAGKAAPAYSDKRKAPVAPPNNQQPSASSYPAGNEVRVHFIDLGQADGILIQSGKNAVLIDGGEYKTRDSLINYLRNAGVTALDYVVATHPHSDHIGGLAPVIRQFDVKNVLMPDAISNTATFEHLLAAIEDKGLSVTVPAAGDTVTAGIIKFIVLAPARDFKDLNNNSIVLRMVHGETAFLFTGDAETASETETLGSGLDLRANVLKAGHHGSRTSTSAKFLDAVRPNIVVVLCGRKNSYRHPHNEFLERVSQPERNITLFRTDESGTIVLTTNGAAIKLYFINGERSKPSA